MKATISLTLLVVSNRSTSVALVVPIPKSCTSPKLPSLNQRPYCLTTKYVARKTRANILWLGQAGDEEQLVPEDAETLDPVMDVSIPRIIRFAVPAVGIWLCNPLLSVIDTSTVGMLSGTVQQAALHPAVAVTDYSARLMYFLFTATTNLVATAFETDRSSGTITSTSSRDTLVGALRVSLRAGVCICAFLLAMGTPMLRALLGHSADLPVLRAAQTYVWIRALGMPAAAMIGSAQAACLGMQDTSSPLVTTLLAAVINFVADMTLVRHHHPLVGGVAGAAWATILSQYVALCCCLYWLFGKGIPGELSWHKMSATVREGWSHFYNRNATSTRPLRQPQSLKVRGILGGHVRARDFLIRRTGQPSSARHFLPYVIPVTATQVGRCSVYAAMGIVVAGMDVVSMAANQIVSAFFYALLPIADSLGQTAQALLPPIFARNPTFENGRRLQKALNNFLTASLWCGAGLAAAVGLMPLLTKTIMTTDPAVQGLVGSVVPLFVVTLLFQGLFYSAEGVLLAQKDLSFVGGMYAMYFAIVPALILQLQRFGASLQLRRVWASFMAYQLVRISIWVARVYLLFRRRILVSSANPENVSTKSRAYDRRPLGGKD